MQCNPSYFPENGFGAFSKRFIGLFQGIGLTLPPKKKNEFKG